MTAAGYTGDWPEPRLVCIADRFTKEARAERVVKAVGPGDVRWVHLRDHPADPETFYRAAYRLVKRLREVAPEVRVSVNARIDIALALGEDLHLGFRGPDVAEARAVLGPDVRIGYSAHSVEAAEGAVEAGADYVSFSPVFPSASKPGYPGSGLDALRRVCTGVPVPVYALGGVTPRRVRACLDAGAFGVAVLSGILEAPSVVRACRSYHRAVLRPAH